MDSHRGTIAQVNRVAVGDPPRLVETLGTDHIRAPGSVGERSGLFQRSLRPKRGEKLIMLGNDRVVERWLADG